LILALAFFFKFSRVLSIRNWDVLSLFLLVPGFLLLEEGNSKGAAGDPMRWFGYLWLLAGSFYFLIRCLFDLALVRRPALAPNLSLGGLVFVGSSLAAGMAGMIAARVPDEATPGTSKESVALVHVESGMETAAKAARGVTGTEVTIVAARVLAILCHLAVVAALVVIGWWHYQDLHGGIAAAVFYLLLPYTGLKGDQLPQVVPIALILWGVVFYRRPGLAGLFLGLAAAAADFPALIFPLWLNFYWRRGAGRFAACFVLAAGVCLAVVGALLWRHGELGASLKAALDLSDWQAWKEPTTDGFWKGIAWAYRLPVFVAYLVLVAATTLWPAPKNLAHVLAQSAALLIGMQFWYADRGGEYVLWYLPLLLLLVFRPNLADRRPPPIVAETDVLAVVGRWLSRRFLRLVKGPEPLVRVG
jgi:hypothetical protein